MAHSFVQACTSEVEAFRAFTRRFPQTTLLVDTYDTLEGVRNVIRLAAELGADFGVRAVRLDSGDLSTLAKQARALLDQAGLSRVELFASGGLDEWQVERLVGQGRPSMVSESARRWAPPMTPRPSTWPTSWWSTPGRGE